MNNKLKIILAALLIACVFTQERICKHLGFGQEKHHADSTSKEDEKGKSSTDSTVEVDTFINDNIYSWDEQKLSWSVVNETSKVPSQLANYSTIPQSSQTPIELDWKILMDIQYRLQFFSEIEMEMYAPVFPDAIKALHEKEVVIEGFVIPFDEKAELLSLSANPYASCFFCGKASPASVMSMYLKNTNKRYKMDTFTKFKGTLYLNQNNPNEFYYILRNAEEI